jgi:hypothetical protein
VDVIEKRWEKTQKLTILVGFYMILVGLDVDFMNGI